MTYDSWWYFWSPLLPIPIAVVGVGVIGSLFLLFWLHCSDPLLTRQTWMQPHTIFVKPPSGTAFQWCLVSCWFELSTVWQLRMLQHLLVICNSKNSSGNPRMASQNSKATNSLCCSWKLPLCTELVQHPQDHGTYLQTLYTYRYLYI